MASTLPVLDVRKPPTDLDALIDWFDRLSYSLVLLEKYPPSDLAAAVDRLDDAVLEHIGKVEAASGPEDAPDRPRGELRRILASDHDRFEVSLDQLAWFLHRVTDDVQGGHEQALGQYGRLLAEALRRHRDDERRYVERRVPPVRGPPRE